MDVAEGIDGPVFDVRELRFRLDSFMGQVDEFDFAVIDEGKPLDVVDGTHRMGDAAAFGDELAVFMADDWDMFLHAGVTLLATSLSISLPQQTSVPPPL